LETPSTATAAALAITTLILLLRARKHYLALPLLPAAAEGSAAPDCMVVIPARNEEGVIRGAVMSLPPDSVIVVNDHSTDATAEESREAGAGVLDAPPLAPGVSGKASACMAGARILESRWILFADADTRYEKGFLESAVRYAEAGGIAMLSVQLTPRPRGLAEHALGPYIAALFFSGASPSQDPAAMFNGQCILALREAYNFLGGHAAVWEHLAEDVKLAQLAQRHRMSFATVRAGTLGRVRNYAGWSGIRRSLERDALRLAQVNPWSNLTILITAVCAALWLPAAAWLWLAGHRIAPAALVLMGMALLAPWYRHPLRVLLVPLSIYAALPMLAYSLIGALAERPIEWKGRTARAA
jgi:chlorobactene glucosyltransferase